MVETGKSMLMTTAPHCLPKGLQVQNKALTRKVPTTVPQLHLGLEGEPGESSREIGAGLWGPHSLGTLRDLNFSLTTSEAYLEKSSLSHPEDRRARVKS